MAQPHVGSVPWSAPNIIPAAQPTPDFTEIASVGQFLSHAPHSIQASRSMICDLPFSIMKIPCGQTSVHLPQPIHFSVSSCNVVTFFKYRIFAIVQFLIFIIQNALQAIILSRLQHRVIVKGQLLSFRV